MMDENSPEEATQDGIKHIEILGVNIACLDKDSLLNIACRWARTSEKHFITYVNAHCLNVAHSLPNYRNILNNADLVYSDGVSVVWAGHFLHGCRLYKITGREWIFDFCNIASAQGISIYILAGAPGIAKRASLNLTARFPGLKIVGMSDGYFFEKSEIEVIEEIAQSKPNILFIGMGVPRQEFWINEHIVRINVPLCWAVGALFDYVAGVEPLVPQWMNRLALEWLWRLMIDPAGKWKRYIFGNPYFLLRVIAQKVNGSIQKE